MKLVWLLSSEETEASSFIQYFQRCIVSPSFYDFFPSFSPSLSLVDLRGARHLLTSQHSLPGIPVALKQSIDLRTSMDGKYKEIAEVCTQPDKLRCSWQDVTVLFTLLSVCLCEGAVLPHSGREWDAQRPLWISRGQPHRTAWGETSSSRAADQPGCQVSAEKGRRLSVNIQTCMTVFDPKVSSASLCSGLNPTSSYEPNKSSWRLTVPQISSEHFPWLNATHDINHPTHLHLNKLSEYKIIVDLSSDTWKSRAKLLTCRRESWFQRRSTRESLFLERRNVG